MKKLRITQIKSGIDRSERQKLTLQALGLKKLHNPREHRGYTTDTWYDQGSGTSGKSGGSLNTSVKV